MERRLVTDATYPFYSRAEQTLDHYFISCDAVHAVLFGSPLKIKNECLEPKPSQIGWLVGLRE